MRPDRFIWQLTSNGLETTRDLANRSGIIRIRKRQGFKFRRYPEGNLLSHIAANQPQYLSAAYCIVGQWLARGKPCTEDVRGEGRFRHWAQALDWIGQEIFGLPPLMDGHEVAQERAANPALNWLRQVCLTAEADAQLEQTLIASDILEICQGHLIDIPGVANNTPGENGVALLRIGSLMKKTFKESESIEVDDFEIHKSEETRYSEERRRDVTINKYVIRRRFAPKCA